MSCFYGAAFIFVIWASIYYVIRAGSIDPHHIQATPSPTMCAVRAAIVSFALFAAIGVRDTHPQWVPFLCMFVLSQTVALPFSSPLKMRNDEEADGIGRYWECFQFQAAGSLLVKIASIALGYTLGWAVGPWWFSIIIAGGYLFLKSKNFTMLLLIQAEDGEFKSLQESERLKIMKLWAPLVRKGNLAYLVFATSFGFLLFSLGGLQPGNWFGWTGLIGGAIFGAIWDVVAR